MRFSREVQRLLAAILLALSAIGFSTFYWALPGGEPILLRDDNPRAIEALARIQRGAIVDRNETPLAITTFADGLARRRYGEPAAFSAVGYYSLRYGSGGAEAAFDSALSGAGETQTWARIVASRALRRPQVGSDIRLTLEAGIQARAAAALGSSPGAALVIDARSGELLALVSAPAFDPNTLDADWERLTEAEGEPFFNRALQGNYQLGGAIYLLWLAQAIEARFPLDQPFDRGDASVSLDDDTFVACARSPGSSRLSLVAAFNHGCPAPFVHYWRDFGADSYKDAIAPLIRDLPAELPGFPQPEKSAIPTDTQAPNSPEQQGLRDALGQGDITTTALRFASLLAAIAADGMAPSPRILLAQKPPDTDSWQPASGSASATAIYAPDTASELRARLAESWSAWSGEEYPAGISAGAMISQSQSGAETQTWLCGVMRDEAGQDVLAFLIILENSDDPRQLIAPGRALMSALVEYAR